MNIEFSQSEAELMDEALKAWAEQPVEQGFRGSIMSTFLRKSLGAGGESIESIQKETRDEIAEAKKEALGRERRALLLRAKIAQALARESEHAVGPYPDGPKEGGQ